MIIVKLHGGLGNQLFQYVFGLKWARYHQTELKIDLSWFKYPPSGMVARPYVLAYFNLQLIEASRSDFIALGIPLLQSNATMAKIWNKGIKATHPRYIQQKGLSDLYLSEIIPDNSYLDGYWIGKYALDEVWPFLKAELHLKSIYSPPSDCLLKIQSTNSICLHIRRGDYLTSKMFLLSTDYFQRGIAEMIKLNTSSPHLFIFSDDTDWCKESFSSYLKAEKINAIFVNDQVPSGENDSYHFHLMTCCKHFIIANSTFSWWAAILGQHSNKIVICPSQFEASNTQHPHLILDDWIPITTH